MENFKISHDTDTASVTVSDATGEVFESNSPKTIGKLIEFWTEEFNGKDEESAQRMRAFETAKKFILQIKKSEAL